MQCFTQEKTNKQTQNILHVKTAIPSGTLHPNKQEDDTESISWGTLSTPHLIYQVGNAF